MKAISIKFESSPTLRYCAIKSIDKFGFCELPERAVSFIKAQSADGKVYQGVVPTEPFAQIGVTQTFYYRNPDMLEMFQSFGFAQSVVETVVLRVIDIME